MPYRPPLEKYGPGWIPKENVTECYGCHTPFSICVRRYHCRSCGQVFCWSCLRQDRSIAGAQYSLICLGCEKALNQHIYSANKIQQAWSQWRHSKSYEEGKQARQLRRNYKQTLNIESPTLKNARLQKLFQGYTHPERYLPENQTAYDFLYRYGAIFQELRNTVYSPNQPRDKLLEKRKKLLLQLLTNFQDKVILEYGFFQMEDKSWLSAPEREGYCFGLVIMWLVHHCDNVRLGGQRDKNFYEYISGIQTTHPSFDYWSKVKNTAGTDAISIANWHMQRQDEQFENTPILSSHNLKIHCNTYPLGDGQLKYFEPAEEIFVPSYYFQYEILSKLKSTAQLSNCGIRCEALFLKPEPEGATYLGIAQTISQILALASEKASFAYIALSMYNEECSGHTIGIFVTQRSFRLFDPSLGVLLIQHKTSNFINKTDTTVVNFFAEFFRKCYPKLCSFFDLNIVRLRSR